MKMSEINPTNRQHLDRLLAFGDEVSKICRANNIHPVVYGSLAYIFYTHDETAAINDIDFLVDEGVFEKLMELFGAMPGVSCETTDYHSVKFFRNGCKLAFDAVGHYLADTDFKSAPGIINGKDFELIDEGTLKIAYERGVNTIPKKKEAYAYKLRELGLLPGRN